MTASVFEQARKGAAENWTPHKCDLERALAELQLKAPGLTTVPQAGARSGLKLPTRPVFRSPLPSLFKTLRRPTLSCPLPSLFFLSDVAKLLRLMTSQMKSKTNWGLAMQVMTCTNCGANNRVDETKLADGKAKCGRCGTRLEATSTKPFVTTDANFNRDILQATGAPILVDAWAPWCGPCRVIAPVLDQLAAESQGRYRIAKLNVDENPRIAGQYQIASIPTMLIFKDGKLIDRLIGAQPKQVIAERLVVAAK